MSQASFRSASTFATRPLFRRILQCVVGSVLAVSLLSLFTGAASAQTAHAGSALVSYTGSGTQIAMAVDASGTGFTTNFSAGAVNKVTFGNGTYTTSALLSGFMEPVGIAVDAADNLYVADGSGKAVYKETLSGGVYTKSTLATTTDSYTFGVAVDLAGNVYYTTSTKLFELKYSGGTYSAPVQLNTTAYSLAYNVTVDAGGNLYVADAAGAIYKYTRVGAAYAESKLAISGLTTPESAVPDSSGNLYIHDADYVRLASLSGGVYTVTNLFITGGEGFTEQAPNGVIYSTTDNTSVITRLANSGAVTFPSTAVATAAAQLGVTFTIDTAGTLPSMSNSNVLTQGAPGLDFTLGTGSTCTGAMSTGTCTVNVSLTPQAPGQRVGAVNLTNSSGGVIATAYISGTGTGAAAVFPSSTRTVMLGSGFSTPVGVAVDAAGDVFVGDYSNNAVKEIVAVGGSIPSSNPSIRTLGSSFALPGGVAVDGAGDVFVADAGNNAVKEILAVGGTIPSGSPTILTLGTGFTHPLGVAVDSAGDVFVADTNNNAVKEIVAVGGSIPSSSPTILTLGSGFLEPYGVAVDSAGDVFVADTNNNAVKEIAAVGGSIPASNPTIRTLGSGFNFPTGVAVDSAGDVLVADFRNNAIKEIVAVGGSIPSSAPTILTLGTGFNEPAAPAVSGSGNVYLTDFVNNAVKEIPLQTPPALSFANTSIGNSSATQTVLLQNVGNAALTFPIPGTGQNPSQSNFFTIGNTSTCITLTNASSNSVSMAAGASCTEVVSFSPTISGSVTGNLIFTDNSLNATNATQTMAETGSTTSNLTVSVVGQTIPQGTSSITLEFTVGYGGNTAPTGTPTLTVNGSSTNVGTVACTAKAGHNNCTATYNSSSLAPGQYTITATQPADSNYTAATSSSGYLTVTRTSSGPARIGPIPRGTTKIAPAATTPLRAMSLR